MWDEFDLFFVAICAVVVMHIGIIIGLINHVFAGTILLCSGAIGFIFVLLRFMRILDEKISG